MTTKFAEVIYETGSKSVVSYDDVEALKSALADQNDRAKSGGSGGPAGHSAERVSRVLLYDNHPGDLYDTGMVPVKSVEASLKAAANGDNVNVWQLIESLRSLLSPIANAPEAAPHDSMFLADSSDELDMAFLEGAGK